MSRWLECFFLFAVATALAFAWPPRAAPAASPLHKPALVAQAPTDNDDETSDADSGAESPEKPLTQEDMELYLKVMRGAAQRVKELPAADRSILDRVGAAQAGKLDITTLKPQEIQQAAELSNIDEQVAAEMGVLDRYRDIPFQISTRSTNCDGCGRDPSEGPDPEVKSRRPADTAADIKRREAEVALVGAYRKEIIALERQVHPLSSWGVMP